MDPDFIGSKGGKIMGLIETVRTRFNSPIIADIPPSFRLAKNININPVHDLVKSKPQDEFKAYFEHPLQLIEAMGYREKPTSVTFDILRRMAVKNSVIAAIILTRTNQVSSFSKPARFSQDGLGYEIRLRNKEAIPTDSQKEVMLALELFLENCGFDDNPNRDNFDTFIRKIVRDSLTYDQMTFEITFDRKNRPAEFFAVDAATIRFASEQYEPSSEISLPKRNEEIKWVQVIDGRIFVWFTVDELAFGVRNPRTDIRLQPYGFSELEQLIHQITAHLYAEEYNRRFFSQGGTTKGILNIKQEPGVANRMELEAFKRQWRAQVSGLQGAWKTPVLQVPQGVEYINVSQSNREMEFEKWMNYLVNISCSVFQIDPAEVNFPNSGGIAGRGGGVFENNNESRIKHSKDKGLRPLLRFIESMINKFIISKFSNEFVFNFVGIDAKTDKERIDLDRERVRVYKTVNEIRREHDEEPIEHGDIILDPQYISVYNQAKQAEAMGGMMGVMGGEGMEGMEGMEGEENEEEVSEYDEEFSWEEEEFDWDEETEEVEKSEILEVIIE